MIRAEPQLVEAARSGDAAAVERSAGGDAEEAREQLGDAEADGELSIGRVEVAPQVIENDAEPVVPRPVGDDREEPEYGDASAEVGASHGTR